MAATSRLALQSRRSLCALHHGPAGHPQQQPRAPARAAPPPLLRRPAAAPSAPGAVESQAPQWGASGDAARQRQELERLVAAGEAMRVPRDWAVESGAGTSSKAPRQQRRRAAAHASHAWPPAPYQHPTFSSSGPSGGSSSSNAPPPKPVASQSAQEREQQQQQPADAEWCTHCRYPCSSSGLPTCEAGEYMRLWDADSHLKPAFFDSSWSGHLPCSSELAVVSMGGRCGGRWKPQNQDSWLLHAFQQGGAGGSAMGGGSSCTASAAAVAATVVGVFDGHGTLGASAARQVKRTMLAALGSYPIAAPAAAAAGAGADCDCDGSSSDSSSSSGNASLSQEAAEQCLREAFSEAEAHMGEDGRDYRKSGSTACLCMILEDRLVAAWAGDSRVVVGVQGAAGGSYSAVQLTWDHKPDVPSERARIQAAGGCVDRTAKDADGKPIGPFRVFMPGQPLPGLAVSRCFGDTLAATIGVQPVPDFATFALPAGRPARRAPGGAGQPPAHLVIVATDGLWEWVDAQRAVEIAAAAATAEDAAHALVEAAQKEWGVKYRGRNADDCTVCVAFL